ncbi:alanine--tRNA ligase [Candidatus Pacearchaeota archaeon]|jgi:alanyl-tRNA synthetase|nr:alanine--tRNA ligase [Candidatus Pacearchaeota archaeon]
MNRKELIKKYIEFFKSKNHKEIQNSSLIPENDPTVLFTTAGMHPLVPYLLGEKHPLGKRLCNVQRCIRTGDIDEVGDETHHTFFEMLGNWSLGDYFKEDAIKFSFEFLTKILKIQKEKLAVSIFAGNEDAKKDNESASIWNNIGIPKERIFGITNNWWGPAGKTGPCGPDTEMFYWKSKKPISKGVETEDLNDNNWVEIWNDVLMEFIKDEKGSYKEAKQKNIDTGMGLERTLAILNGFDDNYLTEVWQPIIKKIEKLSGKKYSENKKSMRIIADHIKASVFIIADGISPSNTEQGYILRRLIRRAIRNMKELKIEKQIVQIAEPVFEIYSDYSHLQKNKNKILEELKKEEDKFLETLEKGIREFKKMIKDETISGKEAFLLYQSYGFPIELTKEIASESGSKVDEKSFEMELKKHQELSRTASAGRFKSGLADNSESTTKLHTATHLLLAALKIILKDENIEQRGANITPERLRFDFTFPRKLTDEELKKLEELVNAQIQKSCEVVREEMSPAEAKAKGACGIFDKKYGEKVSVYSIGNFSKEICTGPHVKNTCQIGKFKILKEESSSSGIRRIKAVVN